MLSFKTAPRPKMVEETDVFRLSFNKPCVEVVFGAATALVVEMRPGHGLCIKPVTEGGLSLVARDGRGGVMVAGRDKAVRLALLKRTTSREPFMLLTNVGGGWYALEHTMTKPARHIPHARFWPGHIDVETDEGDEDEPEWVQEVRKAAGVLAARATNLTPGRPSAEVLAAQRVMEQFARLAEDVLPMPDVVRAMAILKTAVADVERSLAV